MLKAYILVHLSGYICICIQNNALLLFYLKERFNDLSDNLMLANLIEHMYKALLKNQT